MSTTAERPRPLSAYEVRRVTGQAMPDGAAAWRIRARTLEHAVDLALLRLGLKITRKKEPAA